MSNHETMIAIYDAVAIVCLIGMWVWAVCFIVLALWSVRLSNAWEYHKYRRQWRRTLRLIRENPHYDAKKQREVVQFWLRLAESKPGMAMSARALRKEAGRG